MTRYRPDKILIEAAVEDTALARRVLQRFNGVPVFGVSDARDITDQDCSTLILARQRGPFVRLCPGTPKHICCLYHNIDLAEGCDLRCSYCILQLYLSHSHITLYCNVDDLFTELDDRLSRHSRQFFRIGSGELSDSLTLEHFTGLAPELVNFFAKRSNAIIELKSKNTQIDSILNCRHNGRAVISWSLNAPEIAASEERLAPGIDERLDAAAEAARAGYWLGFHFDPLVEYPDWREGYRYAVEGIFKRVKAEQIAWISLGALRYPSRLDEIIRAEHPESKIVLGELLPGRDKKLRYFRPIRVRMFRALGTWIKERAPEVFVYLCMESAQVWKEAFGWAPKNSAALKKSLDERVRP